jgi:hypothetical protein
VASVVPIAEEHIEGFTAALDSVARERKYLARPRAARRHHALAPARGHDRALRDVCTPRFTYDAYLSRRAEADVGAVVAEMKKRGIACSAVKDEGWGLLTQRTLPGGGNIGVYPPRHARPAVPW